MFRTALSYLFTISVSLLYFTPIILVFQETIFQNLWNCVLRFRPDFSHNDCTGSVQDELWWKHTPRCLEISSDAGSLRTVLRPWCFRLRGSLKCNPGNPIKHDSNYSCHYQRKYRFCFSLSDSLFMYLFWKLWGDTAYCSLLKEDYNLLKGIILTWYNNNKNCSAPRRELVSIKGIYSALSCIAPVKRWSACSTYNPNEVRFCTHPPTWPSWILHCSTTKSAVHFRRSSCAKPTFAPPVMMNSLIVCTRHAA